MLKPDLLGSPLTPQEAAIENVGPVDDGTESLGDVPSLSEEVTGIEKICGYCLQLWNKYKSTHEIEKVDFKPFLCFWYFSHCVNIIAGAAVEFKPSDISIETVLSEEGHQVGT